MMEEIVDEDALTSRQLHNRSGNFEDTAPADFTRPVFRILQEDLDQINCIPHIDCVKLGGSCFIQ